MQTDTPQQQMTEAEEFIALVRSLLAGDSDAEDEIHELSVVARSLPPPPATPDCTSSLLLALRWGLQKYGHWLTDGGSFFSTLKRITPFLPTSLTVDPSPLPGIRFSARDRIGDDVLPRVRARTDLDGPPPPEEALPAIRRYLRRPETPKPVGLTVFNLGFSENFSVAAICILTSADLAGVFPTQNGVPVVIIPGAFAELELEGLGSPVTGDAEAMLAGGLTGWARRDRGARIQTYSYSARLPREIGPIVHGASIGLLEGMENKGSAGIFIAPNTSGNGFSEDKTYLITAGHVVMPGNNTTVQAAEIITPGRADILRCLDYGSVIDLRSDFVDFMVRAARTPCGIVRGGRLGVDREGYREDWAVIELEPPYDGENGVWWAEERFEGKEPIQVGRLVGCEDPAADGTVWWKEGATTGWTEGKMSKTEMELFLDGTTEGIEARFKIFFSVKLSSTNLGFLASSPWRSIAAKGDSGAGLYAMSSENNLVFGGLVASLFKPRDARMGPSLVMVVPQSRLFAQLKEETGLDWKLAGA